MKEDAHNKVLALVANLTKNQSNSEILKSDDHNISDDTTTSTKIESVRGIPKSGRFWKSKKERFSTINKTKGLRNSFEKKKALRIELQKTKELSRQMLEELKQKEANRKERRRQNLQRTEENKRKAEVVQVITNTNKLKRMRKKQLRFIEKRDTNKQIEANK